MICFKVRNTRTGDVIMSVEILKTLPNYRIANAGDDDPALNPYRVTFNYVSDDTEDKFIMFFECMAEDIDHAYEQAGDAYPGGEMIIWPSMAAKLQNRDRMSEIRQEVFSWHGLRALYRLRYAA